MKIDEVSLTSVSSQRQIGDLNMVLVLQECGIDPASDLQHLTLADRNPCWPKRQCLSVLLGQVGCTCPLTLGICRMRCCAPSYMGSVFAGWIWRAGCCRPVQVVCAAKGWLARGSPKQDSLLKCYSENSFSWAAEWTQSTFFRCFLTYLPHLRSSNSSRTVLLCAIPPSPLNELQTPS